MANPAFRFDPTELPPEAIVLQGEVRAFLDEHKDLMGFPRSEHNRAFSQAVGRKGWIGMTWPKQYGGQERSAFERYVVVEEMLAAGAPTSAHYTGDRQSGPNILRFGTEEQKNYFCPKIAAGELTFCIGMSEPGSGSDVAATKTRAAKVDGGYRINGSKLWTSNAHNSDYAILFCKMAGTDDTDRHAGASQFLLDLKTPGVEIKPVINLLGEHHFNEIFLTDVFVPQHLLLGQEGNGWAQLTSELSFERSAPDRFLMFFQLLKQMVVMAGPNPDKSTAVALGKLIAQLSTLRGMSLSIAGMLQDGYLPNNEPAVVKDLGTRYEQDLPVIARQLFPTEPELEAIDLYTSMIARATMNAPRLSIQGGTREILRGIIARGLGLR
jgi:alkylation response protein AidB-like acyl-CoA dehydrogenase